MTVATAKATCKDGVLVQNSGHMVVFTVNQSSVDAILMSKRLYLFI